MAITAICISIQRVRVHAFEGTQPGILSYFHLWRYQGPNHVQLALTVPQQSLDAKTEGAPWQTPMNGQRIGEASHPGPPVTKPPIQHTITCVVTNPTSIHNKVDTLHALKPCILCLAETSATQAVQAKETAAFKSKGYHTVWGHPSPPQMREGPVDSMRGAAVGVSLFIVNIRVDLPIIQTHPNGMKPVELCIRTSSCRRWKSRCAPCMVSQPLP